MFSANVIEGCRSCEANQRACAGTLEPGPATTAHTSSSADIDLEAVLGEDRGDTLDERLQRAQFLESEKRNQIIHKLKVRHIDLCIHLHRVTTSKRQGQRVNTKLVQFCNRGSPKMILGAALKLGRRFIARDSATSSGACHTAVVEEEQGACQSSGRLVPLQI